MKTRILFFLAISAILTLSFTFVTFNKSEKTKVEQNTKEPSSQPIGGFMAEDKI